jgi:hypothetical protein
MSRHIFASVPLLALAVGACAQALRVPAQHPTIAAALAAAGPGDTILVAPGTYPERLDWPAVDGIRLIGERGAAATVIDGTAGGPVIRFATTLTRATLLQGFTITNGFLAQSTNRNHGAGIHIDGASPTLRHNRITGNIGDGPNWNYGGGVYVTGSGANPMLAHNEIDGNELRNGSWNYGAGVYVDSSASADLIGNHVHDNKNLTVSSTSTGRGHGAGIYVTGTALIASNLIVANVDDTSGWNYGGGIKVAGSATATILGNTIAANSVTSGYWRNGGGIHIDGSASATMHANIVAANTGEGIFVYTSGTGGTIHSDYDNVWGNSAANYANLVPGGGSLSVDPLFAGPGDYHLSPLSPCIDAVPTPYVPAIGLDIDGDPRQIDLGGLGLPFIDIGADEVAAAWLSITGQPQLGNAFVWTVTATQPSLQLFGVSFGAANTVVAPYGNLLLDLAAVFVGITATPGGFALAIPNDPMLRGITVYGQSLVLPLAGGGQFTNLASVTIY